MCLFIYPCRAISAYAYKEIVFSSFQMEEICFTNTTVNSCSRNTRPHISLLGKESLPIQPWMWPGHCRQKPLTLGSSLPSAAHCADYVHPPSSPLLFQGLTLLLLTSRLLPPLQCSVPSPTWMKVSSECCISMTLTASLQCY